MIRNTSGVVSFPTAAAVQVDSLGISGRVVAPAAGVAIITLVAPPAGIYTVQVAVTFDAGAPVVGTDANNFALRKGAATVSALHALAQINSARFLVTFRLNLDGATNVSVNAIGNATAGVGYNAELILTKLA